MSVLSQHTSMLASNVSAFANPYYDSATTYLPRDIRKTFDWCEFLFVTNPILRSAIERVVQYFITEIQIKYDNENETNDKLLEILRSRMPEYICAGIDAITYGNSISVAYLPFNRYIVCPSCRAEYNTSEVAYEFKNFSFYYDCNVCDYYGAMGISDVDNLDPDNIFFDRIDPRKVDISYNNFNGKSRYFWEIPKDIMDKILHSTNPDLTIPASAPLEILNSIKDKQTFEFKSKYIHHIKTPNLAGISKQWGFPPLLNIMKLNFQSALLRKANEVTAQDHILPFRVLSPAAASANADPVATHSLRIFTSVMKQMIARHRIDPADIQIAPYPVTYQAFGAERKALDNSEEIKRLDETMLHGLNFPAELFYTTMQFQAMPPALRLFENSWKYLIYGINDRIQWEADHICDHMGWERAQVKMARVSLADDMEKKQILMNLSAAGQVSRITAWKPYGIDLEEEIKNLALEQRIQVDAQKELERQMQDEAAMAGPDQQGPAMTGPGAKLAEAEAMAQQLLSMPYEMRRSQLITLKQSDPELHAIVKQKMEDMRSMSQSQAGQAALAQGGMGGAMTAPDGTMMQPGGGPPMQ